MKKKNVIEKSMAAHAEKFGVQPEAVAWAPGRIEVLGNHTDYNEGTVLSAAINLGHCFCISGADHPWIQLQAVDVDQVACFEVNDMEKVSGAGWADYVKGVFYYLQEKLDQPIDGLDCTFFGSIPLGAGLSSSAALEVAAAHAVLSILGETMDKKEIARICRQAEHRFAGTNCGLLDQFSSLFGKEHGLLHSDFRSLEVESVSLPEDIEFLVIDPHAKHSLTESPYNERRERCEQAAVELDKLLPHTVTALRDVSVEEFAAFQGRIDPEAAKRAAHIVGEIDRVKQAVEQIRQGDMKTFGNLLSASHQSSIDYFENSCPKLDFSVETALQAGALGARLSGGGFGGSAIAMVHAAEAAIIAGKIKQKFDETNQSVTITEVTPSAGATLINI